MLVTHLVALATIAIVDGTRAIQGSLAAAKEQEHPVSQILEEYLKRNQARRNERILSFLASLPLQEEQLAKTKEFLQTLLQDEEASITTTTTRAQPPAISLKDAAQNGDVAALAQYLKAGTDLNARLERDGGYGGFTVAHFAAKHGRAAALKFLQEAGANLNARTNLGETPAYLAARSRSAEALEALAEAGADLETPDGTGYTPAHLAARNGDLAGLRVLIKARVDLNAKENFGRTPAYFAEKYERLYEGTKGGNTPADVAAARKYQEALKMILQAGGKVNKLF